MKTFHTTSRRTLAALVLAAVAATAMACAPGSTESKPQQQEADANYPTKSITVLVTYPAGSAPDSTARALAAVMEKELGQTIVIVNKEGANGLIGLNEIVRVKPDGYTIAFTSSSPLVANWQMTSSGFKGPADIQPLAITNTVPSVLFVNAKSDIKTVDDFTREAKAAGGNLTVGVPGAGSILRFQLEQYLAAAGVKVKMQITDAGQQILPVVNGTFKAGLAQPNPLLQYVEKGDLRMIGYFGTEVPKGLDVPLFSDSGYDITGQGYEGFIAPKGVPAPVVDRLAKAIETAVASPEFAAFTEKTFGVPSYTGPDQMATRLDKDVEIFKGLIGELGLAKK